MFKTAFAAVALATAFSLPASDDSLHTFKKIRMSDQFWSEGAHFGDFNRDGAMDVVSGPYWYEGPTFERKHDYSPARTTFKHEKSGETIPGFEGALGTRNAYSDNFFAFTADFNGDGWTDILIYGFPGLDASWYANPQGKPGHWERHKVLDVVDNESPAWADITGDGKPEIICSSKGFLGYAGPDWNEATKPWTFHPVSPKGHWQRFTHGLGYGDVNGDGRMDFLEASGWWEQPESLAGDPVWTKHEYRFNGGGAQMHVYDVNGDGLNDVVTSQAAHGYGLAWFEQTRKEGQVSFTLHSIMGGKPEENAHGVCFSQLHAVEMADMDGDGLKDIVTGKRFWAHGPGGDEEPGAPAVVYWFKLVRGAGGKVEFIPNLIDDDSGVGTQVVVGDLNGDRLPDIVVGNKKGTFAHIHGIRPADGRPRAAAAAASAVASAPASRAEAADVAEGVLPVGADGMPLNLDFELGTLRDWTAEGNAFDRQPLAGDLVNKRRGDMKSGHAGKYWIGTYEVHGDPGQGTLTSVPFNVTHPYATFLIAGGPYDRTCVELVRADTKKVFFKVTGYDGEAFKKRNDASEELRPVVVDLREQKDREIFIRVVDRQDGHWAHINFDDFRFHAAKPTPPQAVPEDRKSLEEDRPPLDAIRFESLPPERAATEVTLPPGFSATLFAGEPDVKQPIAMALDDRGRVWVAEAYSYPSRRPEGEGLDRIVVLEDQDGDGVFNKRTVFYEGLNLVSGIEVGFGGVWVGAAPYLMFIPDKNGDDRPDGEPQIVLDGWAYQDTHETLNTFTWGPDGWLYGCHGVFTHSKVGKHGTPSEERTPINAGIWRYHPIRGEFEVFAEGTSNPWGVDFDDYGQCIIEACVIPHLFHMIQGGRYQRQAGRHFNPYIYDDIKTIGDHLHYAGSQGPHAGNGRSDSAGGGHAHAGLMVYLGDSFPAEYRGKAFMNNIHGARVNMDILEPKGSGYVGRHGADFAHFNDKSSQCLNLLYDQDGAVYVNDWYDINQCHHGRQDGHDRSNGRLFKIAYGGEEKKATTVDLQKKSDAELVQLQLHRNDWYVRHARRILQERGGNAAVHVALKRMLNENPDPPRQLRAMWALQVTDGFDEETGLRTLKRENEYVRGWAVQLLAERKSASDVVLSEFARMAREDESPVVRLYLASALQRLPVGSRTPVLAELFAHAEDADDHNLPLMYWYAAEAVVGEDIGAATRLLSQAKIPLLRTYVTRRMTARR